MSFEHGSVSLRLFYPQPGSSIPEQPFEKFAADAVAPIDAIPVEGCVGWSTGRHLLDSNINEDSGMVAGRIRLSLVKAIKKIPSALFKAECKQEELALMAAKGVAFLCRKERSEIKERIAVRMLPAMPPSLSGIDIVRDSNSGFIYTTACSVAQADMFSSNWNKSTGQQTYAYLPVIAANKVAGFKSGALAPTSFSPDIENEACDHDLGTEFLTWMWYFSEECGGVNNNYAFHLDGPFTFVHEGAGAHVVVIRKGNPGIAQEAKSALLAGKKLKKAKLTIAKGDMQWVCSIDGSEWTFGSLKLPKSEAVDLLGQFEERMMNIASFVEAFEGLFLKFIDIRMSKNRWEDEVSKIKQWVSDRVGKA